ncbi:MAG: hypothetical protein HOQ05_06285 [Corynebacteriales bacterium]|nr:hypothetical protein [Mycobacteriales bacterium]
MAVDVTRGDPSHSENDLSRFNKTTPDELWVRDLNARLGLLQAQLPADEIFTLVPLVRAMHDVRQAIAARHRNSLAYGIAFTVYPGKTDSVGDQDLSDVAFRYWPEHLTDRRNKTWSRFRLTEGSHAGDRQFSPELVEPAEMHHEIEVLLMRLRGALQLAETMGISGQKCREVAVATDNLADVYRASQWLEQLENPIEVDQDLVARLAEATPTARYLDELKIRVQTARATESTELAKIFDRMIYSITASSTLVSEKMVGDNQPRWEPRSIPDDIVQELHALRDQIEIFEAIKESSTPLAYPHNEPPFLAHHADYSALDDVEQASTKPLVTDVAELPTELHPYAALIQRKKLKPELAIALTEEIVRTLHMYEGDQHAALRRAFRPILRALEIDDHFGIENIRLPGSAEPDALKKLIRERPLAPLRPFEIADVITRASEQFERQISKADVKAILDPPLIFSSSRPLEPPSRFHKQTQTLVNELKRQGFLEGMATRPAGPRTPIAATPWRDLPSTHPSDHRRMGRP